MAGLGRPKDGVASLAYVPGIHVLAAQKGVDGRDKPGHDVDGILAQQRSGHDVARACRVARRMEITPAARP